MSNTDTLKQGYEAFGRGDLDGATQNFADDVRWENPEAPQIPNSGTTEGKDNVKQLFAELGNYWESFTITPDEFIESGDTVVVLSHSEAKGKDTGYRGEAAVGPHLALQRRAGDRGSGPDGYGARGKRTGQAVTDTRGRRFSSKRNA